MDDLVIDLGNVLGQKKLRLKQKIGQKEEVEGKTIKLLQNVVSGNDKLNISTLSTTIKSELSVHK